MTTNRNREVTGLARTPASLSWLIKNRAEIQHQLDVATRRKVVCEVYIARAKEKVVELEAQLAATPLDPDWRRKPLGARLFPGQGQLRAMLVELLSKDHPAPTSMRVLLDRYTARVGEESLPCTRDMLKTRFRTALCNMAKGGLVERCGTIDRSGLWRLVSPLKDANDA